MQTTQRDDPAAFPLWVAVLLPAALLAVPPNALGQDVDQLSTQELEQRVVEIFETSCAQVGCHAGSNPQQGMDLSQSHFYGHIVDEPSRERPELKLIAPGQPDSSYLIQKVKGASGIAGVQMPLTGEKLSDEEISVLEAWTRNLSDVDLARKQQAAPKTAQPFDGWKVVNVPTARMVDAGRWLFLISHRFSPTLDTGYDTFFGIDGSGVIFLNMGYAFTDNLFVNLGRSNIGDNIELDAKYRLAQQTPQQGWPLDIAIQGSVNWITESTGEESIWRAEAFKYTGQVILSHELINGLGLVVVPGLLFNPAESQEDEGAHVTIGLGGRWRFYRNLSLIADWTLIPHGFTRTSTFGNVNRFDSWGTGLEISVGGHVFQIVLANSLGLTTDQYLRGGDLDIRDGKLRLGFNIYRILNF